MDIRTKLVFALVGTSLLSMFALGAVGYSQTRNLMRVTSVRQLDALAEGRKRDLASVIEGWRERVGLIGSRTQLRRSLSVYGRTRSSSDSSLIARILDDARASAPSVQSLTVYDASRRLVTTSARPAQPAPPEVSLPDSVAEAFAMGAPRIFDLSMGTDGASSVRYIMPLELAGEGRVGWLSARIGARGIHEVAADTTGLGASGETLIIAELGGEIRLLHPRRHGGASAAATVRDGPPPADGIDPVRLALSGRDTTVFEDAYDDRNRPVWAATRYLPLVGWGIVVKLDAEEERGPVVGLRDEMTHLALSLAAFAILAGVLLGLHLARPIHDLAEVANRIQNGETHVRATIHHEDEVGMLARTFNRMADTLTRGHFVLAEEEEEEGKDREDGAA